MRYFAPKLSLLALVIFIFPHISSPQTIDDDIDFGIWNTMYQLENVTDLSLQLDSHNDAFVYGSLFNYPVCDHFLLKYNGTNGGFIYSIDFGNKDNASCSYSDLMINLDSSSNIIAAFNSDSAYLIEKYDGSNGSLIWSNQVNRSEYIDKKFAIAIDSFNNVFLAFEQDDQYKIVKYSGVNGAVQWESTIAGINTITQFYHLAVDASGNALILDADYRIVKLDASNGQVIWQTYLSPLFIGKEPFLNIDSKNNAIVIYSDILDEAHDVVKIDGNEGKFIWQKHFIPPTDKFIIKKTRIDGSDDIFLIGNDNYSSHQANGLSVVKHSASSGDSVLTINNSAMSDLIAYDADPNENITVSDGGYYFNYSHSDGSVIWKRQLASYDTPLSDLKLDNAGNLICTGYFLAYKSILIYKYNPLDSSRPAAVTSPPIIQATCISGVSATLNGELNPKGNVTEYWFEYQLLNGAVQKTEVQETPPSDKTTIISAYIAHLNPESQYRYRFKALNLDGETTGEEVAFSTLKEKHHCECVPEAERDVCYQIESTFSDSSGGGGGCFISTNNN